MVVKATEKSKITNVGLYYVLWEMFSYIRIMSTDKSLKCKVGGQENERKSYISSGKCMEFSKPNTQGFISWFLSFSLVNNISGHKTIVYSLMKWEQFLLWGVLVRDKYRTVCPTQNGVKVSLMCQLGHL
jgi:hypothetical protein